MKVSLSEFNKIKDRLIAATGDPGVTAFWGYRVHMTLSEWDRLVTLIEDKAVRTDVNEEDRDALAEALYAGGDEPLWINTSDGSPNAASYEYADRIAPLLAQRTETRLTEEEFIYTARQIISEHGGSSPRRSDLGRVWDWLQSQIVNSENRPVPPSEMEARGELQKRLIESVTKDAIAAFINDQSADYRAHSADALVEDITVAVVSFNVPWERFYDSLADVPDRVIAALYRAREAKPYE